MYVPFLSLRYMAGARSTIFSIGAVFVGTAVIVVVMSVMNGYMVRFEQFIRGSNSDLVVRAANIAEFPYSRLSKWMERRKGVAACSGYVESGALLTVPGGDSAAVKVRGIDPVAESRVGDLAKYLLGGITPQELFQRSAESDPIPILVGSKIFGGGRLKIGDAVVMSFPVKDQFHRTRVFRVAGLFTSGYWELDEGGCFVPLLAMQQTMGLGNDTVHAINVTVKSGYEVEEVRKGLIEEHVPARLWSELPEYRNRLIAVGNDRRLLFCIAMLVVMISGFVVMARLILTVYDKTRDIGILRAIGADGPAVVAIFMTDGLIIGIVGAALGIAAGKLFAAHVMEIAKFIETVSGITVFSPRIYEFDRIPVHLGTLGTLLIGAIAVFVSFIGSCVPAVLAVMKKPVEALRYE